MKLHLLISLLLISCSFTTFADAMKRSRDQENQEYKEDPERGDQGKKPSIALTSPDDAVARPCLVCQENLSAGEDIQTLVCSHSFHTLCITPWFITHNTCPTCRTIQPAITPTLPLPVITLALPILPAGGSLNTQLFNAVITGDTATVQALVNAGVDVNDQDRFDGIPLHYAAGAGNTAIVQILITAGSNVNFQDSNQGTPLHAAAAEGHTEIVQLLLAAGADVDIQGLGGFTALHLATSEGHITTLQALIAGNANVNSQCHSGLTPLHLAAHYDYTLIVQELLATPGIILTLTDTRGQTAADIAQTEETQALIEAHLEAQALPPMPTEVKCTMV